MLNNAKAKKTSSNLWKKREITVWNVKELNSEKILFLIASGGYCVHYVVERFIAVKSGLIYHVWIFWLRPLLFFGYQVTKSREEKVSRGVGASIYMSANIEGI